jgi:serine/threonine-protein kinase
MSVDSAQNILPVNSTSEYFGRSYILEQEIGRSQVASLFRAFEIADGRTVAVKVYQRRLSTDPRFIIRFRECMKAILKISSNQLISVLDYGVLDGRCYIATEWVDGVDLAVYLAEHGPLPPAAAIEISSQICSALIEMHRGGLLHRNLKPRNILLFAHSSVKVSDSGLSSLLSESGLSRTHVMVGRFNYIAPEQVLGHAVGPASDIYSLGVLLYEMLTNRLPFESKDSWEVLRMHVEEAPPSPDQINPGIPAALAMIVVRAMQKDPTRRFTSAAEMGEALAFVKTRSVPQLIAEPFVSASKSRGRRLASSWVALASISAWQFLISPAPFRVFGRKIPFGFLLLTLFIFSFALAFVFFYMLTA